MLTPLSLDVPYRRFPAACLGVLALMAGGTALYAALGSEDHAPLLFTPSDVQPWQFLTSLFLHTDFWHLLFNGLYLWIFGRYVEDRVGALRFVLLFLLFGAVASAAYLWKGQGLPALGASGAVAGMMTLTLFQAPRAGTTDLLDWVPWVVVRAPVWFLVGLWLVGEILDLGNFTDGIGHVAHAGGALAGCLAAWVLRSAWLRSTAWYFPREPNGGARNSDAYEALMRSESAWKTIYEHQRRQREMRGD